MLFRVHLQKEYYLKNKFVIMCARPRWCSSPSSILNAHRPWLRPQSLAGQWRDSWSHPPSVASGQVPHQSTLLLVWRREFKSVPLKMKKVRIWFYMILSLWWFITCLIVFITISCIQAMFLNARGTVILLWVTILLPWVVWLNHLPCKWTHFNLGPTNKSQSS